MICHLTVGEDTWCQWTGCVVGQDIARKANVWQCHAADKATANRRAAKLRPHFKRGVVKVVAGPCPHI